METVTVNELRKRFQALGYSLKTKSMSHGIHGFIVKDGQNMPSLFTTESIVKWQPAIDAIQNILVMANTTIVYGPWSKKGN
jgi:hypothetical protein